MKSLKNIAAATAVLFCAAAWGAQPKYIFYYIGDGMGMGPVQAAQTYNRTVAGNDEPLTMMQFPVVGWVQTYSANSDITDSAAAGTALATGTKTKNKMIGMNADSVAVTSVAEDLFRCGYGVGIATSVAADDATPGAFYAHVPNRKMHYEIDCRMAESGYQFVAGSGVSGFRKDDADTDAAARFAEAGVQIVRGPKGIDSINSERVLLLSDEGVASWNIGYTIDSIPGRLTLPMMTRACLGQLERTSPDRFFIMIEGGNIDHALHANDGGASIKEVLNFDEALRVAFEFYKNHPDETLIVVTADHDTGGMVHVFPEGSKGGLKNIDYQKVSKESFSGYCKALLKSRMNYTWNDMKEYLRDNFGLFGKIKVSEKQEARLKKRFDRTFEQRNSADQETLYASFNDFAVAVFDLLNADSGISFACTSHSGNPVPLFAIGVGAGQFCGVNNNIDVAKTILRVAGGK